MMMQRWLLYCLILSTCLFFLTACNDANYYAPVTEINAIEPMPKNGWHRVREGETLYAIAWRYGLDYRTLASCNHIVSPYTIRVNDRLIVACKNDSSSFDQNQVSGPISQSERHKQIEKLSDPSMATDSDIQHPVKTWVRPANGAMIGSYSPLHKGINLSGKIGDPVFAAAAGKVVYCGNGLRSYGNLIILKHNHLYLSAYAHNEKLLVKEGDWVRQGQNIATIGNTGTEKPMLYFAIRRAGKPINPAILIGR